MAGEGATSGTLSPPTHTQEDVAEMKRLGLHCYRFWISWPRLFPDAFEIINQKGVESYNDLIDCVLGAGICNICFTFAAISVLHRMSDGRSMLYSSIATLRL